MWFRFQITSFNQPMRKKLKDITLEDFDGHPIWYDLHGDEDKLEGLVESLDQVAELSLALEHHVWCRILVRLNDGTKLKGIGMYFSDSGQLGNFSIKSGGNWLSLLLPPAPDFVLAESGPTQLARSLDKNYSEVFPLIIETELKESYTGRTVRYVIQEPS